MQTCVRLLILLSFMTMAGCTSFPFLYRAPVQQGNVVTSAMLQQIQPGMTREQVRYILGEPVLINTFNPHRWEYVYTLRPSRGKFVERRVIVYFDHDIVV